MSLLNFAQQARKTKLIFSEKYQNILLHLYASLIFTNG